MQQRILLAFGDNYIYYNKHMKAKACIILVFLLVWANSSIAPASEIMLYPNTENSPSLYIFEFKTGIDLAVGQYILISMDWLSASINPYSCILISTSISIMCTNLASPSFSLDFQTSTLLNFNSQLQLSKTMVIKLLSPLPAGVDYKLQIGLINLVQNMKKISPSLQFYSISKDGLIRQQNLNFGPVAYKPPVTSILGVSIYNDINNLALGVPGALVTLKVQIIISVPVSTPLSSMFFVLQHPFEFSQSSYIIVNDAEQYATNPIIINSKPNISSYSVVSPHLFYVAFNESFVANRKFILQITQIKNPFFIASSNVSIYSANFNSLTPLQAFQSLLPLKTVTQNLNLNIGLPFDMPMVGPCVFYRDQQNYYQIKFYMPLDVPQGYAIKVLASQNTILDGTGFVDFQSLNYTTVYDYFTSNYFIMKGMGPIMQGSLITIIFKASKNSVTNFYVDVFIDTEEIISAGTASSYMLYGRVNSQSTTGDSFFQSIYSSTQNEALRVDTAMTGSDVLRIFFSITSSTPTSTGSYVQLYLSPYVQFAPNFNSSSDCMFSNSPGTAICRTEKTANYIRIQFNASTSYLSTYPNPFPSNSITLQIDIKNIRFPKPSSNKFPYHIYMRIFNSSATNPTTYIQAQSFSVLPTSNLLSASIQLTEQGNVNTTSNFKYPGFVRFACTNPSVMAYTLQQNQERIISIFSTYGFRGLGTYKNQQAYPCKSTTFVNCIFRKGILANGNPTLTSRFSQIERIDIFFKSGSTETSQNFQIIIPDGINVGSGGSSYYYFYMIGTYNKLTKLYTYLHRNSGFWRYPAWADLSSTLKTGMTVDFQGKSGSYRSNVVVSVDSTNVATVQTSYLVISSAWSLFQNGLSTYTSTTSSSTNPQFFSNELSPLSVNMGQGMYISVIPFKLTSSLASFNFTINNLHMPYHYDLPNCYIFTISGSYMDVKTSNQFQMTNQGIFYSNYLQSLNIACVENSQGILNTICNIVFSTQSPLKADGRLTFVFTGMNIATDMCQVYLMDGSQLQSSCVSTSDNKNVTISLVDTDSSYHYASQNFTATLNGISILANQISYSVTVYVSDSTGNYVTEYGTRILTTTVALPHDIEIYEIVYRYTTPLAANKMSIKFSLPRTIYQDEQLGFVMGKDLSDVNQQVTRMKIILTRGDGVVLDLVYELISSQYKVLFQFDNSSLLTATNYSLQIYGIMTPVSLENGAFSIIYQRKFDKAYTLTNAINTPFPEFQARIISNISLQSFINTEGFEQTLVFTIVNTKDVVNSDMVWIVNLPSYYNAQLFNYNAYCMIDSTPIQCNPDPSTPYQLIIKNSPKIIQNGTQYTISIFRLTCPRGKYTNDYYQSYYLFIGVLKNVDSQSYSETALLYPQQNIQTRVNSMLTIVDISINSLTNPTFSSIYAIYKFVCNTAITSPSYLYLIFPYQFDNFNNLPINFIFKIGGSILFSSSAIVTDRTLEIQITSAVSANSQFHIEFPSLPTPKTAGSVKMSQTIGYLTPGNKKSIYAATSQASNSAPVFAFTPDSRYLSFNSDNTITITAGTYSQYIDIKSSDGNPFLTNININLTSPGFIFEPSTVFLRLGDTKEQFRVAADTGLFPVSYFYDAVKSEQVFTYYTITKNNNIMVVNTPISVTLPSSISVPIGGCSSPFTIDITNAPTTDLQIIFIYNNQIYTQQIFHPNTHTTKSQLSFTPQVTTNIVSFCIASNFSTLGLPSTFTVKFVFSGSNYKSYAFTPSQNVTINVIPATPLGSVPAISIQIINRQKTFVDFNITNSVPGNVFYHLQIGQNVSPMDIVQLQVYIKNNQFVIQSKNDFMSYLSTSDRDMRVGIFVRNTASIYTLRQTDMLPERFYTLCAYLETFYGTLTAPTCVNVQTRTWGTIMKAKLSFSSSLTPQRLNNILCYFTKSASTEVIYVVDLQGNSCYNHQVENLHFVYPGTTSSSQTTSTNIYIISNPYLTSDPSPTAFQNMFNSSSQLSSASLALALSGFAINYLSAEFKGSFNAIEMISTANADALSVTFDQPYYDQSSSSITVNNVFMSGHGTVYFLLVLYKQVNIDGNNSYVNIRLNTDPNSQQVINCLNWQNRIAQGCARAVYSYSAQKVVFPGIQANSMYQLYHMAASQFPLRPIASSTIKSNSVVTFVSEKLLNFFIWLMLLALASLALL